MWLTAALILLMNGSLNDVFGYHTVVCIPGTNDCIRFLETNLCNKISEYHSDTKVMTLQPLTCLGAFFPLWTEIDAYMKALKPIYEENPDGIHIIGHSLGSIIARGLVEKDPNHKIRNIIHIAGPMNGKFRPPLPKLPKSLDWLFRLLVRSTNDLWYEPWKEEEYLKNNKFLPTLNGLVDHPRKAEFKMNFLKINKLVMLAAAEDTVEVPHISTLGGYVDKDLKEINMTDYVTYTDDTFGLRTLDKRGRLVVKLLPDTGHLSILKDEKILKEEILPYLD